MQEDILMSSWHCSPFSSSVPAADDFLVEDCSTEGFGRLVQNSVFNISQVWATWSTAIPRKLQSKAIYNQAYHAYLSQNTLNMQAKNAFFLLFVWKSKLQG